MSINRYVDDAHDSILEYQYKGMLELFSKWLILKDRWWWANFDINWGHYLHWTHFNGYLWVHLKVVENPSEYRFLWHLRGPRYFIAAPSWVSSHQRKTIKDIRMYSSTFLASASPDTMHGANMNNFDVYIL